MRTEESLAGVAQAIRMQLKVVEPKERLGAAQDKPGAIEGCDRQQHHADGEQVADAGRIEPTGRLGVSGGLVERIHKSGLVEKEEVSLPSLDKSILGSVSQTIEIIPPSRTALMPVLSARPVACSLAA